MSYTVGIFVTTFIAIKVASCVERCRFIFLAAAYGTCAEGREHPVAMADNLATFLAVTGCEDEASAKFFLESANNDVEQAINTYMEQGGAARVGEGTTGPQDAEDDAAPAANVSVGMAGATPGGAEEQRYRTCSLCHVRLCKPCRCYMGR